MAADPKRQRGQNKGADNTSGATPKKGRRSSRLLLLLAVLAVLVWLLPIIAVHTPLALWTLKLATTDLNGSVSVESVSLGWFSPVAVMGVDVKDAHGKPVLTLTAASSDRTLASLLWNYSNLGRFRLVNPRLSLVLRDDGSNVEDLLAKYLAPSKETKETSSAKLSLAIEIVDGSVSVADELTGHRWQVEKLGAGFEMLAGPDGPMKAYVSAALPGNQQAGKIEAQWETASGGNAVSLGTAGVPLAMFRPLVARFAPGTTLTGQLSSDLKVSWGGSGTGKNGVQADFSLESVSLGSPVLKTDVLRLDRFHAVCQASWQADRVDIEQASIVCDLGNASLTSAMRLDQKDGWSLRSLLHQRHDLNGRVDIARLAHLLPATLRMHRQVEIRSGQVQLTFNSRPEPRGMSWHGQLEAANLTATASGRQIAWQRPMLVVFDAHETANGPEIDILRCESDFLQLQAKGTPNALGAQLSFNLQQLSNQLSQFVDLGTMQLAGEGWGNLNWKRSPPPQFATNADIRLRNFEFTLPDHPPWREENLVATLSAQGRTDLGANTRIDAATVSMKSGTEQFDARLTRPVADLRNGGSWPVKIQARGQLQGWPGRLAVWLPTQNCRLAGAYAAEADVTAAADGVELRQMRVAAEPLIVALPWLNVNEPKLDAGAAGSWNQAQRRLRIEPASLNCATMAVQANHVVVAMPEKGPMEMAGALKFQGDLARLRQWLGKAGKASPWQLAGQLVGAAELRQTNGVIHGETTTDVTNLAVVDASHQQFQEPRLRLFARGQYDTKAGVTQLEQFAISSESNVLSAKASGRIAPVSGVSNADLSGQIDYDLERMAGLFRPYVGPGLKIAGRGPTSVWYRGPFSLSTGSAGVGLKWYWINAYGLRLGAGELKATMANGAVQVEPLDVIVSRGQVRLAPMVRLTSDPMELTLPKGPLAKQIEIDPAMCGSMLKFIAPVLADVATAKGKFSIELDDTDGRRPCRIPLRNPAQGEVTGRFIIHSIEVAPGPLVRSLAVFLGRETPAKLRRESVVTFQMVDGRIYHQGLDLVFPDVTIRTYGSVGLVDQRIAIMAELPVPPKWLQNNPMLAQALRNQPPLRIPITGTLSKPVLDQKVMADLNRKFLQNAAENIIEGEINKQLNRLFGP